MIGSIETLEFANHNKRKMLMADIDLLYCCIRYRRAPPSDARKRGVIIRGHIHAHTEEDLDKEKQQERRGHPNLHHNSAVLFLI